MAISRSTCRSYSSPSVHGRIGCYIFCAGSGWMKGSYNYLPLMGGNYLTADMLWARPGVNRLVFDNYGRIVIPAIHV